MPPRVGKEHTRPRLVDFLPGSLVHLHTRVHGRQWDDPRVAHVTRLSHEPAPTAVLVPFTIPVPATATRPSSIATTRRHHILHILPLLPTTPLPSLSLLLLRLLVLICDVARMRRHGPVAYGLGRVEHRPHAVGRAQVRDLNLGAEFVSLQVLH